MPMFNCCVTVNSARDALYAVYFTRIIELSFVPRRGEIIIIEASDGSSTHYRVRKVLHYAGSSRTSMLCFSNWTIDDALITEEDDYTKESPVVLDQLVVKNMQAIGWRYGE